VGDIRGRGLLRAIELVRDRDTREPFPIADELHTRIKQQAMTEGLICYPGRGAVDGERGDHVLIAPPFNVTDAEIDAIVAALGSAVDGAIRARRTS
jgi:adenosylmethionine-8-amino-7-oxononanoate aminotransferase